jgi:hypothetical protein
MILPEEDVDCKKPLALNEEAMSQPALRVQTDSNTAQAAPSTSTHVEYTTHTEEHAGSEALPPYTPREVDPLLPRTRKRRRRSLECLRKSLPLLLACSFASALTYLIIDTFGLNSARYVSDVRVSTISNLIFSLSAHSPQTICYSADSWSWVNRTDTDPRFQAVVDMILPMHLSRLTFTSTSLSAYGSTKLYAIPLYRGENVIVGLRAQHPDVNILKQVVVCKKVFTNSTVHVSLEV